MNRILSVIIVTADDHHRLLRTLDSITNLDDERIEFIFVFPENDKETLELITRSEVINAVFCFDEQNGIYSAMNIGLGVSSAEYSLFINSGDTIYCKQNLVTLISILEESNCDWCLTTPVAKWKARVENDSQNLDSFIRHNSTAWISHQAVIFRNSIVSQLGNFDLKFRVAADTKLIYQFWIRAIPLIVDLRVSEVEKPFYSSINHRRARFEVAKIVATQLHGLIRISTLFRIARSEFGYAFRKLLREVKVKNDRS